jgi:hypothetical protein
LEIFMNNFATNNEQQLTRGSSTKIKYY